MARLTRLENRLRRDKQGDLRDVLLIQLEVAEKRLLQQLQSLPDSQQRQRITVLLAANAQALQVLATLWRRYHPAADL